MKLIYFLIGVPIVIGFILNLFDVIETGRLYAIILFIPTVIGLILFVITKTVNSLYGAPEDVPDFLKQSYIDNDYGPGSTIGFVIIGILVIVLGFWWLGNSYGTFNAIIIILLTAITIALLIIIKKMHKK